MAGPSGRNVTEFAPPFERFFGYAVLAIAQARVGDGAAHATARQLALDQYALVAPDEKQWCETELDELGR